MRQTLVVRFFKKSLREPTTENDLWADLLNQFELPLDTEYIDFLPLLKKDESGQVYLVADDPQTASIEIEITSKLADTKNILNPAHDIWEN